MTLETLSGPLVVISWLSAARSSASNSDWIRLKTHLLMVAPVAQSVKGFDGYFALPAVAARGGLSSGAFHRQVNRLGWQLTTMSGVSGLHCGETRK
jgi:hypothetical protein